MRIVGSLALAILCSACLSFGPEDEPARTRWFSAEAGDWGEQAQAVLQRHVQVNPPRAAAHLGSQVAWRQEGVEYGFYDLSRWTSEPLDYLTRALTTFPIPGQEQGAKPVFLDVHLEAFEEDLVGDRRLARVRLWVRLTQAGGASQQFPIEMSRPVDEAGPRALATALRVLLRDAVIKTMVRANEF